VPGGRRDLALAARVCAIVAGMLLKIVQVGDPILRAGTQPLGRDEIRSAEIQQLIEWMRETMRDAPGVGLAAPQIGLPLRLAIIEDKGEVPELDRKPVPFHVLVNPTLTLGTETVAQMEGCLSLDGFQAKVRRARTVKVEALDHVGETITIEASGWYARILQHEIDHLDGHLYIDRMDPRTFTTVRNSLRFSGQ
jgi:peptide deformylase